MFDLVPFTKDLDNIFNTLYNTYPTNSRLTGIVSNTLKVNITEDSNSYYLSVLVPGVPKEDISISLKDNNVLQIEVKSEKNNKKDNNLKVLREEYCLEHVIRSIQMPKEVDESSIEAILKEGILSIKIDKYIREPKKVEIKIN